MWNVDNTQWRWLTRAQNSNEIDTSCTLDHAFKLVTESCIRKQQLFLSTSAALAVSGLLTRTKRSYRHIHSNITSASASILYTRKRAGVPQTRHSQPINTNFKHRWFNHQTVLFSIFFILAIKETQKFLKCAENITLEKPKAYKIWYLTQKRIVLPHI
jgi:hypothetical protein